MSISLEDVRTKLEKRLPKILIHGTEGVGKTTFAANAPDPIFLVTEDGLGILSVPHFPIFTELKDLFDALDALITEEHDYKTLVVDSLDWMESLVWRYVMKKNGFSSVEMQPYGIGYAAALSIWKEYVSRINILNYKKDMIILQIAHSEIRKFDSPEHPPYDRYALKLNGKAAGLLVETSDIVGFASHKISVEDRAAKKNEPRITKGERTLGFTEQPAFLAKNRYGMPDETPLSWERLLEEVRAGWEKAISKIEKESEYRETGLNPEANENAREGKSRETGAGLPSGARALGQIKAVSTSWNGESFGRNFHDYPVLRDTDETVVRVKQQNGLNNGNWERKEYV